MEILTRCVIPLIIKGLSYAIIVEHRQRGMTNFAKLVFPGLRAHVLLGIACLSSLLPASRCPKVVGDSIPRERFREPVNVPGAAMCRTVEGGSHVVGVVLPVDSGSGRVVYCPVIASIAGELAYASNFSAIRSPTVGNFRRPYCR